MEYGGFGGAFFVAHGIVSFLIASNLTKSEHKPQEGDPRVYDLRFGDVEFDSRYGDVTLSGWYIFGEDQGPTIIFVHAIGRVRSGDNAVNLASRLVAREFLRLCSATEFCHKYDHRH